ncbi:MAG: hypothetical protein GY750_09510 [Lentisphaerae bacterium]|nr:hypothetical protein [Lentisphaerota bacterium]MCP4101649.1 hypothetical protein [Lentisphaerota bacterium]
MKNEQGFATILILAMTAILLMLSAIAFSTAYNLHEANRKAADSLQQQAEAIRKHTP